jgi:SAM-dependent methyltransferase
VPSAPLPYRDFYFPLNVFMHLLTLEEGSVRYLHYGIFDTPGESLVSAQERSTSILLSRLPAPPARLLDVGSGIGTTLDRLAKLGYAVTGITPDEKQIEYIRDRHGDAAHVVHSRFEDFGAEGKFDALLFQESSQYIESAALFKHARELSDRVLVLDEFATREAGHLHQWLPFLESARANGYVVQEEVDFSAQAAPTPDYFNERLPRYRETLMRDLELSAEQIDGLMEGGRTYRAAYDRGDYVYKLVDFVKHSSI